MIRKIMIASAAYLGRRVIKRAVSGVVKRVLSGRRKPEEKARKQAGGPDA